MNISGNRGKKSLSYTAALISLISLTAVFLLALVFFVSSYAGSNPAAGLGNDVRPSPDGGEADSDNGSNKLLHYEGREEDLEVRGVWIATVANINFPSKPDLSADEQRRELDGIVRTVKEAGLNTIYFQARPSADALYSSELFPVSSYLSTDGSLKDGFDPLKYIIDEAHKEGIAVSAWVNPYRVTYSSKGDKASALASLREGHIARENPDWVIEYDGKLYFDPALPQVRQYVIDGIMEIVTNYDVDGIHIDDYFYPYPVSVNNKVLQFDDSKSFGKYAYASESLGDFRRRNVNELVKGIYEAIKSKDKSVEFGVSPFGIWANSSHDPKGSATNGLESYYEIYCDPLAWIKGGYVDYICPQIYWSFSTSVAPFDVLVRWWSANVDGMTNTEGKPIGLRIGHGAYRVHEFSAGADEFIQQVTYARAWMGYTGSVFYGYEDISKNSLGLLDGLKDLYSEVTYTPAPVSTGEGIAVNKPSEGLNTSYDALYVLGSSDPKYPVYYNGEKLPRTKSGFFSLHMKLQVGKNTLTLSSNGKDFVRTVNRKAPPSSAPAVLGSFKLSGIFPYSEHMVSPGDMINVLITAPAGSTVKASFNGAECKLSPTINPKATGEILKENYSGVLTVPAFKGDKIISGGKIKFTVTYNGETKTAYSSEIKIIPDGCKAYAEVVNDYSFLKISPTSSFYDDYLNASVGMRDYITGLDRGYYKLRFGGYISKDDVKIVESGSLLTNMLLLAKMENKKDTVQLRFIVTENAPVDVKVEGDSVIITIFNTTADYPQTLSLVENPLFSSVSHKTFTEENKAVYTLKLRDKDNYYGFRMYYGLGAIVFDFKSPERFIGGDLPLQGKTIIVDAGHGGSDGGAGGFLSGDKAMNEADMNLLVALELEKSLKALGAEVIMTRTDDSTFSLDYRMEFLNDTLPDLCISVHHNSINDDTDPSRVRGYVGLYCNANGRLLTETVSASVTDELKILERTPSFQKLAMCRNYKFPQTLMELGFMCSAYEYELMQQDGYAKRCADSAARGIVDYFKAQSAFLEN